MTVPVLRFCDPDFEQRFAGLARRREAAQGLSPDDSDTVLSTVSEIIAAVRERGDEAVLEYTERFDGCRLTAGQLRVSEEEMRAAVDGLPQELIGALRVAAHRVRRFQEAILLRDPAPVQDGGRTLGIRYRPVDSTGICVPGASASLASSVLMTVVPAAAAGVGRIAMITPPGPDGAVSPDRLAAAHIAGATEVYRIFGVQGVAALAYGTQTIPAVDFIAGPGNAYVTMAKKAVFGRVGIDSLAGPSEVAIIADGAARADWVAAELLAQAEHRHGSAILLTDDESLAASVDEALGGLLAALPGADEARANLEQLGAVLVAPSLKACAAMSDRLAPEHLVIMTDQPQDVCDMVRHAGAIFLGPYAPVAVGDYIAGPSHCLPTGATARYSGGLTANTFLKGSSLISYTAQALREDADALCRIAEAEALLAHARSVRIRLDEPRAE